MNHFLWTDNSISNKKAYEINIDYEMYCATLVDSGLIGGDPFYCLLTNIHIFHRHWKSKETLFHKNPHRKVQTDKWTNMV